MSPTVSTVSRWSNPLASFTGESAKAPARRPSEVWSPPSAATMRLKLVTKREPACHVKVGPGSPLPPPECGKPWNPTA